MMLLVLIAGAVGWWAWKTRDEATMRFGDIAAIVAALIGLRLLSRGAELQALLALGGAGWWLWFRRGDQIGRARPDETRMSAEQARRLLDLPRDASAEEVRAAHRRLVARVHPDAGGSADLTAQVNAARDTLLARGNP